MRRMLLIALCILGFGYLPVAMGNERYDELMRQGAEYKQKGDWANLEATMKEALQIDDSDEYVGRTYSWAQMQQCKIQEAITSAQENVRRHPCGWSYEQLAEAYWANGDLSEARDYAVRTLKMEREKETGANGAVKATYDRLAKKHFHLEFTIDPQKTWPKGGEIAIGVPTLSGDHQAGTYKLVGVGSYSEFHDPGGNLLLKVSPKGKEKFQLVVELIVVPQSMKRRFAARKDVPLPGDLGVYLGPATMWGNKDCIDPASHLLQDTISPLKSSDDIQTVRNIVKWGSRIRYGEIPYKTVDEVILQGHGHCDATASLMTGLCRAAGIPARNLRVFGAPAAQESGVLAMHSMCEVYIKGVGWCAVDLGLPASLGRLDSNQFRMFHYAFEGADGRLFNLGSLDPPDTSFTMHYED